jgi:hypothetical protein
VKSQCCFAISNPFGKRILLGDCAAKLILLAAMTAKRADMAEATRQLLVRIERENGSKAK